MIVDGLCYTQHGGSGYSFTMADCLDLELEDALHFCEQLTENRETEARKINEARGGE